MATEKLLKAVVTGPGDQLDHAIRALIIGHQFHPINATSSMKLLGKLKTPEGSNPYRGHLDTAVTLLSKLGIEPAFKAFEGAGFRLEDTAAYIQELSDKSARLITHRNSALSLAADSEALIGRLGPFSELGVDLAELLAVRRLALRLGKVKPGDYDKVWAYADNEPDVFLFRAGADNEYIYCLYLALPGEAGRLAGYFGSLGFIFEDKLDTAGISGIPAEQIVRLRDEVKQAKEKAALLEAELAALADRERDALLRRYSWLRYMSESFALRRYAGTDGRSFFLTGWIPAKDAEAFESATDSLGCVCTFEDPDIEDAGHVPVKFTAGFFTRIFAPFVEMYGYPAYGEMDPRLFMTITYSLLFGVMFGDVGQGAVLVLVGLFLLKKKGMWLGRIITAVGCSAIVFGFVYGSIFGNEHILPGFKVLEGGNIAGILLISAAGGSLLIAVCGILNIVTGFRQRDYKKALFSANGVAGVLFLLGLVTGVAGDQLLGWRLMGSTAYWLALAAMLLCIWLGDLLGWLCGERKERLHGVGMLILEGFFDLFEAFLSWLSNCLSFLRVGTYAICHAIMMLIVYTLSATEGGYSLIGLAAGNIIVMVIEAVLVCIQVLRLEFYELFGRFYTGRGAPFSPKIINYADVESRAA
ncbi:MAG TPA: hypothetical protein DD735_02205 [Clostridiales bacterium]|nr:hypothetical protein [Clostridiales bacterium]